MEQIGNETLDIIEKICEYHQKDFNVILNKELILNLSDKLKQYTNIYLIENNTQNNKYQILWIEMLTDCMKAIENIDNILLIDTLKYGIKPFINKEKEII